jgi:sulfur carrier protein
MLMKLIINGTERNIDAPTVAALVEALAMKGDRLAIELNGEIVSRASWAGAALSDGDRLEIVHFVGGG